MKQDKCLHRWWWSYKKLFKHPTYEENGWRVNETGKKQTFFPFNFALELYLYSLLLLIHISNFSNISNIKYYFSIFYKFIFFIACSCSNEHSLSCQICSCRHLLSIKTQKRRSRKKKLYWKVGEHVSITYFITFYWFNNTFLFYFMLLLPMWKFSASTNACLSVRWCLRWDGITREKK